MEPRLVVNMIRTPDGTLLQSHHRHDYKTYTDANGLEYMVDGGTDYARRNVHEDNPYKEMSLYDNDPFEEIRKYHSRGGRGKDGTEPLIWVPLCEMSDAWVKACITYNEERGHEGALSTELYRKELEFRKEHDFTISD